MNNIFSFRLAHYFEVINKVVSPSQKSSITSISESNFATQAHFGLGLWFRNHVIYLNSSEIHNQFLSYGISNLDDISEILLILYHRHLSGKSIALNDLIQSKLHNPISSSHIANTLHISPN